MERDLIKRWMGGALVVIGLGVAVLFGVGDNTPPPGQKPPNDTVQIQVPPVDPPSVEPAPAPDGKDTKFLSQQISVEMALNEIIGHPESPFKDGEFNLKCGDIDDIRKALKAGFSAITILQNAISESKDTREHREQVAKNREGVVEKANKVFERLKDACDVIVNVQENNGNNAIVLSSKALNSRQNARLEILSVHFSEEYFKLFDEVDTELRRMLIDGFE